MKFKTGDVVIKDDGAEVKILDAFETTFVYSFFYDWEGVGGMTTYTRAEKLGWKLKKEPWVPEVSEEFYTVDIAEGALWRTSLWCDDDNDKRLLANNLVFKTPEEAIARSKEILKGLEK